MRTPGCMLLLLLPAILGACADESSNPSEESAIMDESSVMLDLPLRSTGSVQLHARVWEGGASTGATVLAVHGLSESAAVYRPLAQAMLADPTWRQRVHRVIAIDMPGHGASAFPPSDGTPKFGDLAIEDYVALVIAAIDALRAQGMAPSVLIGHSMGGLELQGAQERLLSEGSSLAALGIFRAVLFAPVPPHGRPWTVPMTGDLSEFVVQDPEHGAYFDITPELFIAQSFGRPDGTLAENAPTPAEVADAGYAAPEPFSVMLQLLEAPVEMPDGSTFMPARPSVREGAFAPSQGTTLELVSFSQDVLVQAQDLGPLFSYLSADSGSGDYTAFEAPDAVHNVFVSNPSAVLAALAWPDT